MFCIHTLNRNCVVYVQNLTLKSQKGYIETLKNSKLVKLEDINIKYSLPMKIIIIKTMSVDGFYNLGQTAVSLKTKAEDTQLV